MMLSPVFKAIITVCAVVVILLGIVVVTYKVKNNYLVQNLLTANETIQNLQAKLDMQNAQILQNKQDYDKKLQQFKESIKVKEVVVEKLKYIKVPVSDNVCQDVLSTLNTIKAIYTEDNGSQDNKTN